MGVLLSICYIISKLLFIRTPMEGASRICRLFIDTTKTIYINVHNFGLFFNIFKYWKGYQLAGVHICYIYVQFMQNCLVDPQIDCNNIQKKFSWKLILLQSLYCLGWNILLSGVFFIYFCQLSYCFFNVFWNLYVV